MQSGRRSYDEGLERLLDKVAGEREGLSDAEVAQTLAEGGIRSINRRLHIDANMARAREAVAELERAGVRHCDEIWDLLHHLEDGADDRTIGAADNELTVRWVGSEEETIEVQLKGQWEGIVTTVSVEGATDSERMTFEQIARRRHRRTPL